MNQSINTDSKNSKEPQQKYRLGTFSIKIGGGGGLNRFSSYFKLNLVLIWYDDRVNLQVYSASFIILFLSVFRIPELREGRGDDHLILCH